MELTELHGKLATRPYGDGPCYAVALCVTDEARHEALLFISWALWSTKDQENREHHEAAFRRFLEEFDGTFELLAFDFKPEEYPRLADLAPHVTSVTVEAMLP